jgi:hypothetical protein
MNDVKFNKICTVLGFLKEVYFYSDHVFKHHAILLNNL